MCREFTIVASLWWMFICFSADLACGQAVGSKNVQSIEKLIWLSGSWVGTQGDTYTEEHWIEPRGGMMLAVNRTSNGDSGKFEFLRIQQKKNGSISLLASPAGRPEIEFEMTETGNNKVVFENAKHDFPQKITYQRNENTMHVRIEAVDNGRTRKIEWTWQRKN